MLTGAMPVWAGALLVALLILTILALGWNSRRSRRRLDRHAMLLRRMSQELERLHGVRSSLDSVRDQLREQERQWSEIWSRVNAAQEKLDAITDRMRHGDDRVSIPDPPKDEIGSALPVYSEDLARRVFRVWCMSGRQPTDLLNVEIIPVRFYRMERETELDPATPQLEDASGVQDFVRLSAPKADRAMLFPHPDALFNSATHPLLFPRLEAREMDDRGVMSTVEPVPIRRRAADSRWEPDVITGDAL